MTPAEFIKMCNLSSWEVNFCTADLTLSRSARSSGSQVILGERIGLELLLQPRTEPLALASAIALRGIP